MRKKKAAKHIEKELCIAGINVAYEVRCMLDACEKAVINRVLEIVDENNNISPDAKKRLIMRIEALKGSEQE